VVFTELEASLVFADAVIIPGTKNTVDDLIALSDSGFFEEIRKFQGYVVGICGGFQMLGSAVRNAGLESVDGKLDEVEGLGLLPVKTEFSRNKRVKEVTKSLKGYGPLSGAEGDVTGYEIHMGESCVTGEVKNPLGQGSAATDRVLGTYLHGLFENELPRKKFVENLFSLAGKEMPEGRGRTGRFYEGVADLVEANTDLTWLLG
jgi:adenosylcobyric acid synthase